MRRKCRERFYPPPTSRETASLPSWHMGQARDAVMHVRIANPWWRGKPSRHSQRMRNTQFYVYGKRPIQWEQININRKVIPWTLRAQISKNMTDILLAEIEQ